MLTEIATLDALLDAHRRVLGRDFTPYRNHTYRVVNLCAAQSRPGAQQLEKMAIAAAFHDMGIWTAGTFDYLLPSVDLASAHLLKSGRTEWIQEISRMIIEHHKISPYRDDPDSLVEPFRRSDWVDVSWGVITFGLPRRFLRELFSVWPSAGFHTRLIQLELTRLRTHPWRPLPMMKL